MIRIAPRQRWGKLEYIKEAPKIDRYRKVICRCDCGTVITAILTNLRRGNTLSCGCLQKERAASAKYIHGYRNTTTYKSWTEMRGRCKNESNHAYYRYGGRGIKVCNRWSSFILFLKDMGECPPNMSIDRIDNDGDYEPGNCRWATKKEQARNTSRNIIIEYKGEKKCLASWAESCGIKAATLRKRLVIMKWPTDKAMSKMDFRRESNLKGEQNVLSRME